MALFRSSLCGFFLLLSASLPALSSAPPKRVYLASYPRSGNHWVRYLFEEATGVMTYSVWPEQTWDPEPMTVPHNYQDQRYGYAPVGGYEGNRRVPRDGEAGVVKTHHPNTVSPFDRRDCQVVMRMVREPKLAIRSHFHHGKRGEGERESFFERSIRQWKRWQEHWDRQPKVVTFRYEDLASRPHKTLKEMLEVAGYSVTDEDVARAVERYPPRPSRHDGEAILPFSLVDFYRDELAEQLQVYGY